MRSSKSHNERAKVGTRAALLVAISLLPCCNDDGSGTPKSGPGSAQCQPKDGAGCKPPQTPIASTVVPSAESALTPVTDCQSHATAVCAGLAQCAPFYLALGPGDEANCRSHLAAICEELQSAGTPIIATLCDAAMAAPFCQAFLGGTIATECWQPPGGLPNGGRCAVDADCSSLFCDRKGACGTCTARADVGQSCSEDRSCKAGLICTPDGCRRITQDGGDCDPSNRCGANGACLGGRCQAPGLAGQPCESGTCDTLRGLGCDQQRCVAVTGATAQCSGGSCRPTGELGDACSDDSSCAQPAYCSKQCTARVPSPSCP